MYKGNFSFEPEISFMSMSDREKWDAKYQGLEYITGEEPSEWLSTNEDCLQGKGSALDIASGEGRNAVFAAGKGYQTMAVDISNVGLSKALTLAKKKKVTIKTRVVDLDDWDFGENAFDLILCFNFLDRRIFSGIRNALKPGGLVFYETFTIDYLKYSDFRRDWVLEHNELLDIFHDFRIFRYREIDHTDKAFASLVAMKKDDS